MTHFVLLPYYIISLIERKEMLFNNALNTFYLVM